jgi:hypothetical protein
MPVSVVARSGSFLSVFEQTAQNFPCLPVRDDIQDKNSDNTEIIFYIKTRPARTRLFESSPRHEES